ncbi:MAG: hypothetical protein AB7E79_08780 [Rhodospirillaceae bacterium]
MTKQMPPMPPAGRSTKGPTRADMQDGAEEAHVTETDKRIRNQEQQGRQANIAQNTRNQGYQQDR